jgi:hypothetical protein
MAGSLRPPLCDPAGSARGRAANRRFGCIAVAAMSLWPVALHAEPTPAEMAMAEALFLEGKDLLAKDRVPEACAKLAASMEIDPRLGTLLNLATCHEKEGKTASAWAEFAKAVDLAKTQGQTDRMQFAQHHRDALRQRLSYLAIEVGSAPDNLEISLDSKPLSRSVWSAPWPVDPGQHRISASTGGLNKWSQNVGVGPGPTTVKVQIPPMGAHSSNSTKPAPDAAREDSGGGSSLRTAGFVIGTAGVLGILAGAATGAFTFVKESEADKICPGRYCSQKGLDLHQQADTFATISTITLPAGIACLGVGVTLLLVARSKPSDETKSVPNAWVSPVVGPHAAGIAAGGVW